jgi:hypothetical protein
LDGDDDNDDSVFEYIIILIIETMSHDKIKVVSSYIYNPSDLLGTGTWGSVYLARHKETG